MLQYYCCHHQTVFWKLPGIVVTSSGANYSVVVVSWLRLYQSKMALTSLSCIYIVFYNMHMPWMMCICLSPYHITAAPASLEFSIFLRIWDTSQQGINHNSVVILTVAPSKIWHPHHYHAYIMKCFIIFVCVWRAYLWVFITILLAKQLVMMWWPRMLVTSRGAYHCVVRWLRLLTQLR